MTDLEPHPTPSRAPLPWATLLPLAILWVCALLPVALFLVSRADPVLAVEVANTLSLWIGRLLLAGGALTVLGLLAYPPFPAWLRRFADRARRSWTVDRAPLLKALQDLEHFETAQKHFEVARIAWLRTDLSTVGPHAARAVELDPRMPQAHHLFGQFLLRVGATAQASRAFAAAEELDPGHAFGDALLMQARALALSGEHEHALARFEQHQAQHGGGHRSNYWRGEALAAAGHAEAAGEAFRAAAADPKRKLPAEENWFRALARVKSWRFGGKA